MSEVLVSPEFEDENNKNENSENDKISISKDINDLFKSELQSMKEIAETGNYSLDKDEEDEIFDNYNLNPTDRAFLKYKLKYPVITNKEISQLLKITPNHVSKIANKPAVISAIREFDKKWFDRIDSIRDKVFRKIEELLDKKIIDAKLLIELFKYILPIDKMQSVEKPKELSPVPKK